MMKSSVFSLFGTLSLAALLAGVLAACQPRATAASNPVEVGTVTWGRDLETALSAAKSSGKPVFLLFQEVPGCSGCKSFGREVLSDPAVVKMIEDHFIPLLIHNNKPGKDAEVLKRFNEPAWNYQVVRFTDSSGKDLIPRKDRVWTVPALTARMKEALEKSGRPTPIAARKCKQVAFSQSCFSAGYLSEAQRQALK